ncbi:MAG TPA: alpha/beta hydrolase [Acidimicrobiales bacterium]|nr:alpha/beta hydrolase [Acidimicrobiales bacterium]
MSRTGTVQRERIPAGDVALDVLEAGRGGRPLLLVHGFCGAKEDFAEALGPLTERGWHVVVPDLRGHGGSDKPAGTGAYSLAALAADVIALAEALSWRRFTLLGHSMGGMVAQLVALAHPGRLDGLVLMDTGHGPLREVDAGPVELAKAVVAEGGTAALVKAQQETEGPLDTPAHQRLLVERAGYREFCEAKTLGASADMWLGMVDELFSQPDRLQALRGLRVPTLVIVGEQDAPFLGDGRRMAAAIPSARLAVISNAGHSPQFEAPERWLDELSGFLDELGGPQDGPDAPHGAHA